MVDVSLVPALELGAWSVPGTGARVDDGGCGGWNGGVRSQALSVEVGALATRMISVELSESTSRTALDVDHDGGTCRRR